MADIGAQLMALWDADEAAEAAEHAAEDAGALIAARHASVREAIADRIDGLEEQASHALPQSLQGALLCLALANGQVELWRCGGSELRDGEVRAMARRIRRLLYAARHALECATGTPAEAVGAGPYMPRALNPHALLPAARSAGA